jgi:CubicO group peptidase (beta-lactamase class C family)
MALGIVWDGQIAHLQGFGTADSSGRAVTPQTPFYLGSVTKSFTALAVMQLVEAGKIDLDAPVQEYLPWFELADKEAAAKITVRNLLNQTTGISTIDGDRERASQQGLEEMVRGLGNLSLTEPVGMIFQYSNLNFDIAGLIVEKVSGQPYADYVTQNIFEPLEMRHSYGSRAPAVADGLAEGHSYMFGHAFVVEGPRPPAQLPSGYLIASVEDMTHYAIAQLNDGRYGEPSILSPQGMAELHAPAIPMNGGDAQYAMGWVVGTLDGTPFVGHDGALRDFRSAILLLPESGWGVILLANAHGFEQLMQVPDLAKSIVGMLNGKPPLPVSLPIKVRFLYWAILLIPLSMILGIAYGWRYWQNKGVGYILLTVIPYGTIALLWLFGVPLLIGSPIWSVTRINYPELAYGWIAGVVLGLGWSVIFTVMNLRARRSEQGLPQR